jgi:hypothetical protein
MEDGAVDDNKWYDADGIASRGSTSADNLDARESHGSAGAFVAGCRFLSLSNAVAGVNDLDTTVVDIKIIAFEWVEDVEYLTF